MLLSPLFYRYYCTWELHAFTIVVYGNVCTRGTLDWKVLCFCGTLGNGTFCMYPLGRFPTLGAGLVLRLHIVSVRACMGNVVVWLVFYACIFGGVS